MNLLDKLIDKIRLFLIFLREAYWFFFYKIIKKEYFKYYSIRMDNLVSEDSQWGLKNKKFQIDYLISYGLKKNMKFLDYGCGAINSGRYFIDYLNEENYVGVDVSEKVLKLGEKRVDKFKLRSKKPRLIHIKSLNQIKNLNEKFDVVWGQSVLTHMPPEDLNIFLKEIKFCININSKILFTFALDKNGPFQKKFKIGIIVIYA